jgi:hypothetical protein
MSNILIQNLPSKTTPIDVDVLPIVDSTGPTTSNVSWANVKATLKTYLDTLYLSISNAASTYVPLATYDANTILAATTDNTPVALTIGTNTVVGRVAGNITTLAIDNDLTSVSAADDTVPSAKATKTYSDLKAPIASPTFTGTVTSPFTVLTAQINEAKGADIASATTTDIGAATGNYVNVTGTTTITGLGTIQAGTRRIVTFTGALTLTHNATSLILPGAANIGTANGDAAEFVSLGAGNWKCVTYTKANGQAIIGSSGGTTSSSGVTTLATGTTNITHGLGSTPTRVDFDLSFMILNGFSGNYIANNYSTTHISSGTVTSTNLAGGGYNLSTTLYTSFTSTTAGRVLANPGFPTTTFLTISAITSTQFTLTWTIGAPGGTTDSFSGGLGIKWVAYA